MIRFLKVRIGSRPIVVFISKGLISIGLSLFLFLTIIHIRNIKTIPQGLLWQNSFMQHIISERNKAKLKIKLMTINSFRPKSFDYLADFFSSSKQSRRNAIEQHLYYYKRVVEFYPQQADVHEFLGFGYYHLGDEGKAIKHFQKAVALNPNFFWSEYNLGVIYFNAGDYQKSARFLNKAITINPEDTVSAMSSSRVYQEIIQQLDNPGVKISASLKEGYQKVSQLLSLSKRYQNVSSELSIPQVTPTEVKIF